jgi:hypothetical protein
MNSSMESYEQQRDLRAPELKMAATAAEESARMTRDDANIRSYMTEHEILTVAPDYRIGRYVAAFDGFGELDDFTGVRRCSEKSAPLRGLILGPRNA